MIIAFVGSDGFGKTTIVKKLLKEFPGSLKYMYMGLNLESSNYLLPTSKILLKIKLKSLKKNTTFSENDDQSSFSTHHISQRQIKRNKVLVLFRTINRIMEAWYRQIISWFFKVYGNIVIYDRHFLFDTAPRPEDNIPLSNKIFRWFLTHFYPKPDLVFFLDADPEILLKRKQEVPYEYLANQRIAILEQGKRTRGFIKIDAAQSIEKVYSQVEKHIKSELEKK